MSSVLQAFQAASSQSAEPHEKMPRTEVTKKIWAYIKSHKLNEGRVIKPDAKLKAVFPVASPPLQESAR